ncbi:MAG: hypothetical protein QOE61_4744, partial [Micromonosporaceae bacterium]|nr:hypothetical protein [Micromonosporaceae bacterium]
TGENQLAASQSLLMLAVYQKHVARVTQILERDGVP